MKKAWVESRRGEPFRSNPGGSEERVSTNEFQARRRCGQHSSSLRGESSSFSSCSSSNVLLHLVFSRVFSQRDGTRRTRRPGETTVSEERELRSEQHESPRTTIDHRRRSSARSTARTNERTDERRTTRANERTSGRTTRTNEDDATFSHGMLACFEYVNIFYSTLSLGRGIKLFPPRGCHRRPHAAASLSSSLWREPRPDPGI